MSAIGRALLDELEPDDLRHLAAVLAPFLPAPTSGSDDGWLTTKQAAAYLGLSVDAIHRHTSARTIPFEQSGPGAKCYFRRDALDDWRRS